MRTRKLSGVLLGTLLIATGYLVPPPRWTHLSLALPLPPPFLALSISIVFFLAMMGGYVMLASIVNQTMKWPTIIAAAALVGSLSAAVSAGDANSLSFEIAKSITLSAGVILGSFLRAPQSLPAPERPNGGYLSGSDLHAYMGKRIEFSHCYRRNLIDNLIRWYTAFITVNYISMGWFASGSEENKETFVPLIAAMFITQNGLGIMACLRIRRYLVASSHQIVRLDQALIGPSLEEEQEALVPSRVYGRSIQLMVAGLIFIVIVWVVLSIVLGSR